MFDDWAAHGEDWGETDIYVQWESKQLNRSMESCRWLTTKELRASSSRRDRVVYIRSPKEIKSRYGYSEAQVVKLCSNKDWVTQILT